MKKQNKKKESNVAGIVIRVISILLILALLGAAIALIYRFTNGFNEDFKTFYLEYNGAKILQSKSEMNFTPGSKATFGVKYTFDFGGEARDYSVKIHPNDEEGFSYEVGGKKMQWRASGATEDLNALFGLEKGGDSFTLTFPGTIETVLQSLYPDEEVFVEAPEEISTKALYQLEVSSYNGDSVYVITFSVSRGAGTPVTSVELDRDNIIFSGGA